MKKPTEKQLEVMLFIDEQIKLHDNFPTFEEIGEHCGLGATGASERLRLIAKKGLITKHGYKYKRTQAFKQIINELGER